MIDYKKKMTIGKAKKILRGFLARDCYIETPLYYAIPYLLDYITNLQTIEQQYSAILSENAELENKITNLQNENEELKKELNALRISEEEWLDITLGGDE